MSHISTYLDVVFIQLSNPHSNSVKYFYFIDGEMETKEIFPRLAKLSEGRTLHLLFFSLYEDVVMGVFSYFKF